MVRVAEGYAFMVPAGGTACCFSHRLLLLLMMMMIWQLVALAASPLPSQLCVRLTLLLEVIRLGYPEVGQWLCTSDWVMPKEDVCPQPSKIPTGSGWFEEQPITLKGTPSGYRRWSSKGKKPSNISRRQRCRGRRERVRTS